MACRGHEAGKRCPFQLQTVTSSERQWRTEDTASSWLGGSLQRMSLSAFPGKSNSGKRCAVVWGDILGVPVQYTCC